jgi:ABC-type nitrate/sulfonate/bicarbonate transport system permease component
MKKALSLPVQAGTRATRSRVTRVPWAKMGWHAASVILLLGIWQLIGHSFGVLFVPFSTTVRRLWETTVDGPIPSAMAESGQVYLVALAMSIVFGVLIGLAVARSQWISDAFEIHLYILYATPTITLVPFMFAAFGYGFWPQTIIAMLIAIFPVLIGTTEGARSIPSELIDVAKSYGSSERQLWRHVILPYVVPHAMTGVKQAVALALVGTLVAQFFLNATGVAALLLSASTNLQPADVLAVTLLISIIAVILVGIGETIERYFTRWR